MIRAALLSLAALAAATPALAEWPTHSFVPVPPQEDSPQEVAEGGFEGFAKGAGDIVNRDGRSITVESLDIGALRRGAVGALTDVLRANAIDAAKMDRAGFPTPKIEPLIKVQSTGEAFYPIFWVPKLNAPFRHTCTFSGQLFGLISEFRHTILANGAVFPYARLRSAYNVGGTRKQEMMAYMTSQLTHEVVHTVQAAGYNSAGCGQGSKFLNEGTADGVAYYLTSKRVPDLFDTYSWARNTRRYDLSLDVRQFTDNNDDEKQSDYERYSYASGSFFRYLIEASEGGAGNPLKIIRDILTMPPGEAGSRDGVIHGLDRAIKANSGGRGLYRVLPEFLTEYASYGESRYKRYLVGKRDHGPMKHDFWIERAFVQCVDVSLTPGAVVSKSVSVLPLAGECVKVTWSGFKTPVALQFYADGAGEDYGSLHMGEAVRSDAGKTKFCYDATKGLKNRIALKMAQKCILKRGATEIAGAGSGGAKEAGWTSDFSLLGAGEAYFVVSNVAHTPEKSKRLEFNLIAGALEAKNTANGKDVEPAKPGAAEKPVTHGMTDIDKRVHALSGSSDRMLFDGRGIFDEAHGTGFLEGLPGGSPGDGVFTLVRGGDYWVGWVGVGPNQLGFDDAAMIIKDPPTGASRGMKGLPGMRSLIMSGGMMGMQGENACGYDLTAKLRLIEETPERMKFSVEGDLFDAMRAARAGVADRCAAMKAAFVEHALFEVTLPNGKIYAGDSQVSRGRPPGQEVYDRTDFYPGPNFGGIATSESLATEGPPTEDMTNTGGDDGGGGGEGGDGSGGPLGGGGGSGGGGGVAMGGCDCGCPDRATPATETCKAQCRPIWAACGGGQGATPEPRDLGALLGGVVPPEIQAMAGSATPMVAGKLPLGAPKPTRQVPSTPKSPEPDVDAQRNWFAHLIADQGLTPGIEKMLADDFAKQSAETRKYLIHQYRDGLR